MPTGENKITDEAFTMAASTSCCHHAFASSARWKEERKSRQRVCRFDYPKPLRNQSIIEVEELECQEDESQQYRVHARAMRDDELMGSVNPTQLKYWRASRDIQLVTDPVMVIDYMVEYTTKAEKSLSLHLACLPSC